MVAGKLIGMTVRHEHCSPAIVAEGLVKRYGATTALAVVDHERIIAHGSPEALMKQTGAQTLAVRPGDAVAMLLGLGYILGFRVRSGRDRGRAE